jgi:acyl-CoA synthetase (AMP-forming)/AMP-acid ligase II
VSRSIAIALLLLGALLAAAVAPAAEPPTRPEYVQRLEAICKPDALATERTMKGARAEVQGERFKAAAAKFAKATGIYDGTVKAMSAVPRPSADLERLSKWFTYLKRQVTNLRQITKELRAEHAIKAQRLTARFIHNGNLANNVVLAFGFNYCSFKFSRYG